MEQKLGRKLSNNEVSYAVHQSRTKKLATRTWQNAIEALYFTNRAAHCPRMLVTWAVTA